MKRTTSPKSLPDDLITVAETADLVRVEPKTIYRWTASWLPHYKFGARCIRFSRREVLESIARRRINGIGEAEAGA